MPTPSHSALHGNQIYNYHIIRLPDTREYCFSGPSGEEGSHSQFDTMRQLIEHNEQMPVSNKITGLRNFVHSSPLRNTFVSICLALCMALTKAYLVFALTTPNVSSFN